MQVIRNKGGYVIRVSNVEWEVLQHIHEEGVIPILDQLDDGSSPLSGPEKSILTQVNSGTRPWMTVTEDRRK